MLINCYACMHTLYYEIPLKSSCALYFGMDGVSVLYFHLKTFFMDYCSQQQAGVGLVFYFFFFWVYHVHKVKW